MTSAVLFAEDTHSRLGAVIADLSTPQLTALEDEIRAARRIFVTGAGRSFLAIKFFGMRLMQIGLTCYVVGDVCTPSVQPGDVVIIVSGSGETPAMIAISDKAHRIGARVALVTERASSTLASRANAVLSLPMPPRDDSDDDLAAVPAGNSLEVAVVVILDALVCNLMRRTGVPLTTLEHNHANLE